MSAGVSGGQTRQINCTGVVCTARIEVRTIAHPPDKKRRLEKRERKRRQSLDGDGSWRIKTGERRRNDRRKDDQSDSPIIHLPFLDEQWDTEEISEDSPSGNPCASSDTISSDNGQQTPTPNGTEVQATKRHDTAASAPAAGATMTDSGAKRKDLTPEQQARLHSLKSMLDASNIRYQQAAKNRRPVFAAGLEVKVLTGDHEGEKGVVLDADYIESRALVSIQGQDSPIWMTFRALGNAE